MSSGGATRPLLYSVFAAAFGMSQVGFNTGVINTPRIYIQNFINENNHYDMDSGTILSIIVSIFAIGGMIGCPLASCVAERGGRKLALLVNTVFGVVGAALMGFSKVASSLDMLIAGRFLIGINCGFATTVSPTYIFEVAPISLRGALGAVNQVAFALGLMGSQILSVDFLLGSDDGWPWLLGLAVVPSAVQCVMILFAPESPRYLLLVQRDEEQTRSVLTKIRGTAEIDDEINDLYDEDHAEKQGDKFTFINLFCKQSLRTPLIVGIVMHLSQQISGINAFFYYSTAIFKAYGVSHNSAGLFSFGTGSVLFTIALVSIPLMDRLGRRTLQMCGLLGMTVCTALLGLLQLVALIFMFGSSETINNTLGTLGLLFVFLYIVFFGIGPSSIPWIILPEFFGQSARSTAVSVGALVNWFANFIVVLSFIPLFMWLSIFVFVPFLIVSCTFFVFTYYHLPETKNRKIMEVTTLFKKQLCDFSETICCVFCFVIVLLWLFILFFAGYTGI